MKVLGILGSPRRGGNAERLLDMALDGARESGASVEKISLNELTIRPCQECGGCDDTGECVVADDMAAVYSSIDRADRIILASPIFFGELTAQTKAMIDRFQCRWVGKYRLKNTPDAGKKGVFLCVSAWRKEDFFENAKKIVKIFFVVLDIKYAGDVWCKGVSGKEDIRDRPDSLEEAFRIGKALASS